MNANLSAFNPGLVAAFRANATPKVESNSPLNGNFREDFAMSFRIATGDVPKDTALGLLLKYSYYDGGKDSWSGMVSSDKAPWDNLTSAKDYSEFGSGEMRAINMAIRDGMLEDVPTELHYISLGPGGINSFVPKDGRLIGSLIATGHNVKSATTIDINDRYAREAAAFFYETHNFSTDAFQRDFFAKGVSGISVDEGSTPLIVIFGGTGQNIPKTLQKTRSESTIDFFTQMRTDLPSAHLIMTVDGTPNSIDPAIVMAPYQYSLENELFLLNFMVHAKAKGIITDPNYNILRNWRAVDPEWAGNAVNGYIEAKNDHTLTTIDGDYDIKAGTKVSVSTSKKGPIEDHADLLREAGFNKVNYYPQTSQRLEVESAKYIIHACP